LNGIKLSGRGALSRFYYPTTAATEEQVDASVVDYQIDASYPAPSNISPTRITWRGGAGLGAVFTATAGGAGDERARYSFLSGIALATAAAALIALLQELHTVIGHEAEVPVEKDAKADDEGQDSLDA
jgi:hypothetical protein